MMLNGTELGLSIKINVVTPENVKSYANPSKLPSSSQLFYSGVSFTFGSQDSSKFLPQKKKLKINPLFFSFFSQNNVVSFPSGSFEMSVDLSNTYLLDYSSIILKVYDNMTSTWQPASFQCSSTPQILVGSVITFPLCSFGQYAIYSNYDGFFSFFFPFSFPSFFFFFFLFFLKNQMV